jgi:hypothetical protein
MYRPKDPYVQKLILLNWNQFLCCREGRGSFYGTIGGAIKDVDPTKAKYREETKPPKEKSNFKTNPSKKGTGYGYISFLISSYFQFSLFLP